MRKDTGKDLEPKRADRSLSAVTGLAFATLL